MKTKTSLAGAPERVHIHENRHPRPLHSFNELAARGADMSDVDYIEDLYYGRDEPRLFVYRGSVYDGHEFEPAPGWIRALGYDSWQTESVFSAVVVTWFDRDGDTLDGEIIVGYVHW